MDTATCLYFPEHVVSWATCGVLRRVCGVLLFWCSFGYFCSSLAFRLVGCSFVRTLRWLFRWLVDRSVGYLVGCLFCKVLCSAGLSGCLADCSVVQSVVNRLVFPSVDLSVLFLDLIVKFLNSTLRYPHCLSCLTFQQSGGKNGILCWSWNQYNY